MAQRFVQSCMRSRSSELSRSSNASRRRRSGRSCAQDRIKVCVSVHMQTMQCGWMGRGERGRRSLRAPQFRNTPSSVSFLLSNATHSKTDIHRCSRVSLRVSTSRSLIPSLCKCLFRGGKRNVVIIGPAVCGSSLNFTPVHCTVSI